MTDIVFTESEIQSFKELFSKYCKAEEASGHCGADTCEFCPINTAYAEIFDSLCPEKSASADYLDKDIVELFTENGERFVHFMGYGYVADGDTDNECRFMEFVHNTIPLDVFIHDDKDTTADDYNEIFNAGHHNYIEDCDEDRIIDIYENGYGEKPLEPITRATAASLPDGFYLWDWSAEKKSDDLELIGRFKTVAAEIINTLIDREWQAAEIQDALGLTYDSFQSYIN